MWGEEENGIQKVELRKVRTEEHLNKLNETEVLRVLGWRAGQGSAHSVDREHAVNEVLNIRSDWIPVY